jgi:formiminotetrahydrofolate cyclodeaminase
MEDSVWTGTIEALRARVAGLDPVPAGVAISAATASLALALLAKVLAITADKKSFSGDGARLAELLASARNESQTAARLGSEDIAAFRRFSASKTALAAREAIEIPMNAAHAAVRGLHMCEEAAGLVAGLMVADVAAAAALLAGAIRAILTTVDVNVRQMGSGEEFLAQRSELESEALRCAESITEACRPRS